ncbi:MAG TPA: 4Fe-4S double cluster binding domain-containing protein, partial [Spirochaetota bacterium]|nr:4Fe-4S double cluster binding domain-containing protein [Spirochaetota bacterium]
NIVDMNWKAVDNTEAALQEIKVPSSITKSYVPGKLIPDNAGAYEKNIIEKIMYLKGDDIPTSHMPFDGVIPTNTTKLEKRGISPKVPKWVAENCIQCNQCSLVCPHAAIRAKQVLPEELKDAPASFKTLKSTTKNEKDLQYKIQIYIEDCTGCGNCVNTCPGKQQNKALVWSPIDEERKAGEDANFEFFDKLTENILDGTQISQFNGSQFRQPLFEFSGACEGCGETPYVKLITQLFGERMVVANATGCSSIYGGTFPTVPYSKNKDGKGPAWGNSLFEDNAEYSYGFRLAINANRNQLKNNVEKLMNAGISADLKSSLAKSLEMWTQVDDVAQAQADKTKKLLDAEIGKLSGDVKA